ncbi:MAG TPA: glycosyltransferase family 39 protein [Patescibacteria group bacterium]|nr:glycosyltransferase family 39 protein [Patescibacteria group bacterium]
MRKWAPYILVGLLLFLAAALRLTSLDWDGYNHYHPDERYITWVATSIEWPDSLTTALDPHASSFNPFYWPPGATSAGVVLEQDQPRRYAYGHLPLYMGVAATRLMEELKPSLGRIIPESGLLAQDVMNFAERNEFRHLTIVGRALTGLIDTLSVLLIFILGRQLFGVWVGLLGAAFAVFTVMFLQLARFFTVDAYLTFFVLLTIVLLTFAQSDSESRTKRLILILLAAASIGLAVGSKFTGILLMIPLGITVLFQKSWSPRRRLFTFVGASVTAFLVFFVTNPFALIDQTCEVVQPLSVGPFKVSDAFLRSCYLQNIVSQATMVQGTRDVPFVRQYAGTIPYLYFIEMQVKWGMGLLLGIVAFVGFGWEIWRGSRVILNWFQKRRNKFDNSDGHDSNLLSDARYPFRMTEFIVLGWAIPFFFTTGALSVKFMRYLEPLVPYLLIYAAAMLLSLRSVRVRRVAITLILIVTGLYAIAFLNLYRQPHPWVTASQWIFTNVESGSTIATEMWDDRLPDNVNVAGTTGQASHYGEKSVNWLSGTEELDSPEKVRENLAALADADYIALASNRNYGVIPRLPERYPLSSQYYPLLFEGLLGYDVVYVGSRMPNILGFHLKPDSFQWPGLVVPREVEKYLDSKPGISLGRFDESFTVYDQPLVIILRNTKNLSADEMYHLFSLPDEVRGKWDLVS